MRRAGLFVASSIVSVALIGVLLGLVFRRPADAHAIVVSAVVALVVQIALFVAVRASDPKHLMTAWGLGAVVRLLTLVVYGVLMVKAFHLAPVPALISLASFFFVTTIIESRLLVS